MVYQAYGSLSEEDKEQPWLSVSGLCRIMKCSTSGYYEWKRKYEDPVPSEKTRSDKKIKEKMLKVINGEIDMPTYAQLGSMTYEIGLRRTNPRAVALLSPGTHELETRWVTDTIDTSTGAASVSANKEIVKGFAKSLEGGTLENNASQEANLVLEVAYYKYIQDGETLIEIDKLNNVFLVNGVDYGQAVRDNL